MEDFAGKVAVVTGAGSGMGRAFAERFGAEGMKLAIGDIEASALERASDELRAKGYEVTAVQIDVSKKESIERLAKAAVDAYGTIHVACNNAGVEGYLDGAIWEATDKDWAWTIGVNFWSVVYGTQVFLPIMLANDEAGHMVNTCSMTSVVRAGNMYAIAKQAIFALTETTYANLRQRNAKVGITALCPGIIATRLFQGSRNRPAELENEEPTPGALQGKAMREQMHERLSKGMPPAQVAEILLQAIRDDRLYCLTDHEWDDGINERWQNILSGTNPTIPG